MEKKVWFRYSWLVRIVTFVCVVASLVAAYFLLTLNDGVWSEILGCFLLVIFPISSLFAPLYYFVDEEGLHLRILAKTLHYPEAKYTIESEAYIEPRNFLRLCGSGGLFGYTGLFRDMKNKKNSWFFLTNEEKAVIRLTNLETGRVTYVGKR